MSPSFEIVVLAATAVLRSDKGKCHGGLDTLPVFCVLVASSSSVSGMITESGNITEVISRIQKVESLGFFGHTGATNQAVCTSCSAGTYSDNKGAYRQIS